MTPPPVSPELILLNGKFHTMDARLPEAQAVAIYHGQILAVGDDDTIGAMAGASTQKIDLDGRLGLPGMLDAHFHFYEWARIRKQLYLADVASLAVCLDRIHAAASDKKPGEWIVGQGFNESDWPENRIPTRRDLDKAAPDHPVIIWRCDLHLAVANTRALDLAGVGRETPDPPEGLIQRDTHGEPSGILRELAINLVKESIPPMTEEAMLQAMQEGMQELHSLGVTGLHDVRLMGGAEGADALRAWLKLDESERLRLRAWVTLPGERIDEAVGLGLRTGFGNNRLRLGHLKYFADGGMGARTAWMIAPYVDAGSGMPLTPIDALEPAVAQADDAGLAVMIHAVGDRTNRELARMFERLAKRKKQSTGGNKIWNANIPHRVEHLQMSRRTDLKTLADLQIAGCVQPHNLILDINMIDQCVGEKGRHAYAFRNMLDAGVQLMFSSDCPVADPNPLAGIHAAVTRQRADGSPAGGWYPNQRVMVDQAIRAYTLTPAIASGAHHYLGSLSCGKCADIVVLDQDIYRVASEDILDTGIFLTIFDGDIVFSSGKGTGRV
ncbi:MAG: amidohydrolase [Deltaproteobacteria bacterium]|nr:amidohydrolase [Deltaproteobacteria bacterium]